MKLFRRGAAHPPHHFEAPPPEPMSEADAVAAARGARQSDDWAAALMALERVPKRAAPSAEFKELRAWAAQHAGRKGGADGWAKLRWQGRRIDSPPGHLVALTALLTKTRPATIIELGSRGGGLAHWLLQQSDALGLASSVHSADWTAPCRSKNSRLQFWTGDLRKPSGIFPGGLLKSAPRPWLLLARPGAGYAVTWSALRSMLKYLQAGDVICVESEPHPAAEPGGDPELKQSSADAIARFVEAHPVEFEALPEFDQSFGRGAPAAVRLLAVRCNGLQPLDTRAAPDLPEALQALQNNDPGRALTLLNALKAARESRRGTDYLRALCFLQQGAAFGACEAAKEELRYFPDHPQAAALFENLMRRHFPTPPAVGDDFFKTVHRAVRRFTMLSDARLLSLYQRTRLVCELDIPGDLVECGVAAGGGSALIAATMARHTKRPRKLYSCDTFEGMPEPTGHDVAHGVDAEASGWGTGTCSAPEGSLREVCEKLGVASHVVAVKGLFKDTLPGLAAQLQDGIAMLHMDGDWYESTRDILVHLYDRVQPRGFIQIDDYGHWEGCRRAVHEFEEQRGFEFAIQVIDNTGVWTQRPDAPADRRPLLNLGCGARFHPEWVNLDIAPADPRVLEHDLASGPLPFAGGSCAAVYHSHVLEHIPPEKAPDFIAECFRVLAPGGVIRVVVPDLEGICREYLKQLEAGDRDRHEWMVMELVDQLSRHRQGGAMLEHWLRRPVPARDFILSRMGAEAAGIILADPPPVAPAPQPETAEAVGRFRLGGEVHRWMYDRLSLGSLLAGAGFTGITVRGATESSIANFGAYQLDAGTDGAPHKPDSLFMEAVKAPPDPGIAPA
jgi:cephalosporin hydroxylase/SAM-dependent methyltransferase